MRTITLHLQAAYNHLEIPGIDISTFNYSGYTSGYSDQRQDSFISFRLMDDYAVDSVYEELKKALNLNVDKNEYIKLCTMFPSYEEDKRPCFSLRLPSGLRGMANPAQFSFSTKVVTAYGNCIATTLKQLQIDHPEYAEENTTGNDLIRGLWVLMRELQSTEDNPTTEDSFDFTGIKCAYCDAQATSYALGKERPACAHCLDIAMLAAHG